MSYEKTNWQKGDVITAEKLNKIENGIESATDSSASGGATPPLVVPYTYNGSSELYETETTFGEIRQAFESGRVVLFRGDGQGENYTNLTMVSSIGMEYIQQENSWNISVSELNTWSPVTDYENPPQTLADFDECTLYRS